MKRLIYLSMMILGFILMSNSGCDETKMSSDEELQVKTENSLKESNRQIGIPSIINFQEKKNLKWIYELCDQEDVICHVYLMNEMNGTIGQYLGKCIGYGIPYSTQFSNPIKTVDTWQANGFIEQLPQPEPNGLFKPEGLSATWLIMIDPESGKPRPVYVEPSIIVSPFKLN